MPGAFLQTAAPSGAPWEHLCRAQPPTLAPNGFVGGAWGECVHWAVIFERQCPDWSRQPGYQEEGPVGQVIAFAAECGHSGFCAALEKNEEATNQSLDSGNQAFVFQQIVGQPQPIQYGAPQPQPMQYGAPQPQLMQYGAPQPQPMQYGAPAYYGMAGQMAPAMGVPQQQMMGQAMGCQPMMGMPMQGMVPLQQINPYSLIAGVQKIQIEEKMNLLETATGLLGELMGVDMELEMANKYVIKTVEGHPLFFAVEQTDFCNRQCGGDCRGIDIDVVVLGQDPKLQEQANGQFDWSFNPFGGKLDLSNSQKFIHLHKECQFTCCCFNRPVVDVIDSSTGQIIGKIRDPWACCDMTFTLMDPNDQEVMTAKGGCCQLGLICPCPCGPCREVHFDVNDAKSSQSVGHLTKIVPDCLKFITADDVDNYEVEFGQVTDPKWRAMLVALGLFVDFRYFNTRSDKNDSANDVFGGGGSGSFTEME